MYLIAYSSTFTGSVSEIDAELESIVQSSKANNPEREITGVMFYHGGRFLQFLEGEQESVESLMRKIAADPRHEKITYLFREEIEERGLTGWNMDSFNLDDRHALSLGLLELITKGYRKTLKANTAVLVGLFKEFIGVKV